MSIRHRALVDYQSDNDGSVSEDQDVIDSHELWERKRTSKTRAFVNKYKQFAERRKEEYRRSHARFTVPSKWEQPQQRDRHAGLYSPDCTVSYSGLRRTPSPTIETSRGPELVGVDGLTKLYMRDKLSDIQRDKPNYSSRRNNRSRSPIFPSLEDREVFDIVSRRDTDLYGESDRFQTDEMFVPVDWVRTREPDCHDDRGRNLSPHDRHRTSPGRHRQDRRRSVSPPPHFQDRRRSVSPPRYHGRNVSVSPVPHYHNRRRSISPQPHYERRRSPSPLYPERRRPISPDSRHHQHRSISPHSQHFHRENDQNWSEGGYHGRISPSKRFEKQSFDAEKEMFHSEMRKRTSDSPKHLGDPIPPPPPPPVLSVSLPSPLPYMPTDYSKPLPFKSSAVFQTDSVKQSLDLLEKVKRKQEILSRCELKIGELYRKRSKLSNAPSAFFPSIQKIHLLESCHSPVTFVNKLSLTFNSTSKITRATELSHPAKEGAVTEQSETQKKLVDLVIPQGLSETLKLLSDNKQATSNPSTLDETQGLQSSLTFSPEPQNFQRILDSPRKLENWDLPSHSNDKLQSTYNPILEMAYGRTETTHTNIGFSSHHDNQIPWEETRHLNVGTGWPNYSKKISPSRKLSNKVIVPPPSVPFRVLPPEQHSLTQREQARPGRSQITLNLIPKGNSPNISTVTKEDSAYVEKVEEFLAKIQGGHDVNKRVDRESVVLSSDDDDVIYVGETKRQSSSRRRNRVSPLRRRSSEQYRCRKSTLMKHIETNAQSVSASPEVRQSPPLHGPPNKKLCLINQIERSNTNLRDNDHVNESPVLVAGNEACSGEPLLYQPQSEPVPAFNALPGRTLTLVVGKDNSFKKHKQEHSSHISSVNRSYKLPSNPQKILEQQSQNLKQIVVKDLKNCRSVKNRIPFEKINNQVQQLQPMVSLSDYQHEKSISKGCDLIKQSKLPTLDIPVVELPCNTKYVASADDFPKSPAKLQNNSNCTNTSDKKPFVLNETVDDSLKQTNCIVDIGAKGDTLIDKDKINVVSINNEISQIKTYIEEPKQLMSDKHNVNISEVLNSQSQPSECVTVKDQMETSKPNERQDSQMKTADDSDQSSVKAKKPVISEIVTQSNTDMKVLSSDRTSNKTNPINSTSSFNPDEVSKMPDSGKKDTSNFEAATKLIPEASLNSDDIDNIFNHGNKVADDVRKIQMGDVRLKKVFNNTLRNRTINKNLCIINELLCLNNDKYGPRIVVSTIEEHIIYYVHYLYNHCINGLPSILRKFFTPIKELSGKIKTVLKCCQHCFKSENQSSFIIKNTISSEGILSDNSCYFSTNSLTSFSSNNTNNEERHSSLSNDKNLMVEKNTSPHFEKSCDEDSKVTKKKNCNNIDTSSSPLLCIASASKISSLVDIIGNNVADDRTGKEIQEKTLPPLETPGNATDKNKVIENPLESIDLESVGNNPNKSSLVEISESSQMHGVNKENKRFDGSLKIVKKNDSLKSQQSFEYRTTKYDKNIDLIASDNQKLIDPCNITMKNNTYGVSSEHAAVPLSPPKRARITYGDDKKDTAAIQDVSVSSENYSLDLGLRLDSNCSKEDNSAFNSQGNMDRSQITTQGLFDDASKTKVKPETSSSVQQNETIKSSTFETHTSSFRIEDKTIAGENSVVKTKSQILASNVPSFTKKNEKPRRKDPIARVREIQSSSDHIKNIISKIDQVDYKLLYFIKNKLVLKKCNVDGKALVKILIPEDKIDEIINVAHTEFCSHGNVNCVLSILEKHFSPFPNLVESVKRNVLLCNYCNGNS